MFELIFIGFVIWAIWLWRNETRLERQKQKFVSFKQEIESRESEKRNEELLSCQRENMRELAFFTIEHLDRFQREIPPRLFDELKDSINKYVEGVKFDKLHELYNLLRESEKKSVLRKLHTFRR